MNKELQSCKYLKNFSVPLYDVFQKYLEIEDQIEVDKRDTQKQIDRLEHENKSLESRIKSYQDHSKCFIELTNPSVESSRHYICLT